MAPPAPAGRRGSHDRRCAVQRHHALDRRLAEGDVACLLLEPALTNIGIVLPDDGYLAAVRDVDRHTAVFTAALDALLA